MIESLIDIDQSLFITIHHDLANTLFDGLMPIIRNAKTWIPLYIVFIYFIFKKYKTQGFYILLSAIFVVALTDQFSAGFMKPEHGGLAQRATDPIEAVSIAAGAAPLFTRKWIG